MSGTFNGSLTWSESGGCSNAQTAPDWIVTLVRQPDDRYLMTVSRSGTVIGPFTMASEGSGASSVASVDYQDVVLESAFTTNGAADQVNLTLSGQYKTDAACKLTGLGTFARQ